MTKDEKECEHLSGVVRTQTSRFGNVAIRTVRKMGKYATSSGTGAFRARSISVGDDVACADGYEGCLVVLKSAYALVAISRRSANVAAPLLWRTLVEGCPPRGNAWEWLALDVHRLFCFSSHEAKRKNATKSRRKLRHKLSTRRRNLRFAIVSRFSSLVSRFADVEFNRSRRSFIFGRRRMFIPKGK